MHNVSQDFLNTLTVIYLNSDGSVRLDSNGDAIAVREPIRQCVFSNLKNEDFANLLSTGRLRVELDLGSFVVTG